MSLKNTDMEITTENSSCIRRSDTKNCSQKGFLAQLWHQKICRTQLWQKSIWEKFTGKKS